MCAPDTLIVANDPAQIVLFALAVKVGAVVTFTITVSVATQPIASVTDTLYV